MLRGWKVFGCAVVSICLLCQAGQGEDGMERVRVQNYQNNSISNLGVPWLTVSHEKEKVRPCLYGCGDI
jgi:hypothetical protein